MCSSFWCVFAYANCEICIYKYILYFKCKQSSAHFIFSSLFYYTHWNGPTFSMLKTEHGFAYLAINSHKHFVDNGKHEFFTNKHTEKMYIFQTLNLDFAQMYRFKCACLYGVLHKLSKKSIYRTFEINSDCAMERFRE